MSESDDIIRVAPEPLDADALIRSLRLDSTGAIATFIGVVRDQDRGRRVHHLVYEAYPPMAERELRSIAAEIRRRWAVSRVGLVHRTGRLEIGEASVIVAVSAPHRKEALQACAFGIERLKLTVPIWKKEFRDESEEWIIGEWVIGDRSAEPSPES